MTSISNDFWYQSILISGLNGVISIILIHFWYWFLLINYVWKDVRLWGCEAVRVWGCEAVKLWGWEVFRLWDRQAVSLHCKAVMLCEAVRLGGCEAERLSGCETMRLWDYGMRLWYDTTEAMRLWIFRGGVAFSLIPSFTFTSFKNSQITLDNLAWSAIRRDLTS